MVFLIISFPVSASAMRGFVFGENELPNFSKGLNDKLIFEIMVNPTQDHSISLNELFIRFPSFDNNRLSFASDFCIEASCEDNSVPNEPSKKCRCVSNWHKDEPFQIVFEYDENNNNNIDSSVSVNFFPDYKKPYFNNIELTQIDDQIEINYRVIDEACNNCNTCSGIREIQVLDSSGPRATFEINTTDCIYDGINYFNYTNEGLISFDLIVKDMLWKNPSDLNHQSISISSLSIDFTPPVISSNFEIYKNNNLVNYISSNPINNAKITFTVQDPNLDKISAKLSDLGNNNDIPLTSIDNCILNENIYECSFNNVQILNKDLTLEVTAVDKMGNSATLELSSNLQLDEVKPVVEFLGTNARYNDESYVKSGENTFLAIINDDGSGISKENVFLNLGSFNQGNNLPADECILENSKWHCKWHRNLNNLPNDRMFSISLSSSTDNAGNNFEGITSSNIKSDTINPDVERIEIFGIGELGERTYYQSNDLLRIYAYVKNDGSPLKSAKADFSNIYSSSDELVEGDCVSDDAYYLCQWQTSQIKAGYYIADINFIFTDSALNVFEKKESIIVYGISTNVPNNFEVRADTSKMIPRSINRMVASLLPNPPGYKLIVPINLIGGGSDIKILDYYVEGCLIDGSRSPYENLFMDIRNPTPDSVPLIKPTNLSSNSLEFTMGHFIGADLNLLNDFEVTCFINIYQSQRTMNGYHTFAYPENKNFTFNVQVSGTALDERPGEKVVEEIQRKREGIIKDTKFITDAVNIVKMLERICALASQVNSVWGIFASIESLGAALNAKEPATWGWLYTTGCYLYEGWGSIIGKIYYGAKLGKTGFSVKNCNTKMSALGEGDYLSQIPAQDTLIKDAFNTTFNSGGFPGLRNICGYVSCEYSTTWAEGLSNFTGGDLIVKPNVGSNSNSNDNQKVDPNALANNYLVSLLNTPRNAPSFNTKNSIIMSSLSLCIPGIIYNLDKYRQIECDYVMCLRDTSISGGPISICQQKKSQTYCVVLFGEMFEVVGIFRLASAIGSSLSSTVVDLLPQGLKAIVDRKICNEKGRDPRDNMKVAIAILCTVPRAIHNSIDDFNRLKGIARYGDKDTWSFSRQDVPDSCSIVMSDDFIEGLDLPEFEFSNESNGNETNDNEEDDLDT
jgi:hypothetical protein